MVPVLPDPVGADLLSAPAGLPDEVERVDDELVDLLCRDQEWVDETFAEIVATSWDEPPRGGVAPGVARPRRLGPRGPRHPRHDSAALTQWRPLPGRRQRSPPRS